MTDDYEYYHYTPADYTPPDPQTKAELERWDDEFLADLIAVQREHGDHRNADFNEATLNTQRRAAKIKRLLERGALRKAAAPTAAQTVTPAKAPAPIGERRLHPTWETFFNKHGYR